MTATTLPTGRLIRRLFLLLAAGALVASTLPAQANVVDDAPAVAPAGSHTISYDRYSLLIDGERVWLWSAEFHYYRLPNPDLWRDQLEKLKASGFNAISVYFSWAYHSPAPGVYDFTGVRDIERLLDIAEDVGLYVLARPGPYLNAELDSGGYPAWLTTQAGRARTRADDYQAAWEEWFDHVNAIISRHQLTDGGGSVVLFQIENEYDGSDAVYMEELKAAARADGITVPLFHNDKGRNLRWASGLGAPDLYATDTYPAGFDCNRTSFPGLTDYRFLRSGVGDRPFIWGEFQGGAFDPWGGPGYDRCRQMTGPTFERMFYNNNIENQFTVHNIYMTYGGTSWGWQADPNVVYTSYDYGAAFNEQRELTEKVPVLKQQAYLVASVADLAKTDDLGQQSNPNPALRVWVKENPDTQSRFYFVRHAGSGTSATNESTTFSVDVPDGTYTVPQQAGTALQINGRDFKILPAGYDLERQRLVYSTSEIMTHTNVGDRDVALLHGRAGEPGETVLRYAAEPDVQVVAGDVTTAWDAAAGDLRLNYTHGGLARVRIVGGGRPPLELLLADSDTASTFWRLETDQGVVLARGPYLVRSAEINGAALMLRGDTDAASELEVFADSQVRTVFWNGRLLATTRTDSGSHLATLAGPQPVSLPALTGWRYQQDVPEADPEYDDSSWTVADKTSTTNPTQPATLPVLYTDEYDFHYGDVWYRGHFTATGDETSISLTAGTGRAGAWAVWVNGVYLDTVTTGTTSGAQNSQRDLTFPEGVLRPGEDNVVSVLVRNMGHNENGGSNDGHKAPRGLVRAQLQGPGTAVSWRIQGVRGGEQLFDEVRGPLNNGGLHGERVGYTLPGFPDGEWAPVTLPHQETTPGVAWYRTTVDLALPADQDVPVGLRFSDDPARRYRVLIFVNGWNVGQYINNVGPQRVFTIPQGILRHQGTNTLALAVWSYDGSTGGLGQVSLEPLGNYLTANQVGDLVSPGYGKARFAEQDDVTVRLTGASGAGEEETFTATARLAVPNVEPTLFDVSFELTAPEGWTVDAMGPTEYARLEGGVTEVHWQVTSPAGARSGAVPLKATVIFTQSGAVRQVADTWFVGFPPPPPPPGARWVSDLPFVSATNGWGPVERDMSNGEQAAGDGGPITIDGVNYPKGIGTHAVSEVVLALGEACTTFHAIVGVDDIQGSSGSVVFSVVGDGDVLATTPVLRGSSPAYVLDIDVTGVDELRMRVGDGGDGIGRDHADWGEAMLICPP
jgi:beta-galactosidase